MRNILIVLSMLLAFPIMADEYLGKLSENPLPGNVRILNKLGSNEPMKRWFDLVEKYELGELNIKNKEIEDLITASEAKNENRMEKTSTKLIDKYYGRH